MKDLKSLCTILVNSCDSYSDVWPAFFGLLKVNWPDCPCKTVLNTEYKEYFFNGEKITLNLLKKSKKAFWCERYLMHLMSIDTEYVFVFLDDDFIQSKVDNNEFNSLIEIMDDDPNIACISIIVNNGKDCHPSGYPHLNAEGKESFRFILNCSLWRRNHLIKYLKNYAAEDPWKLEGDGMKRSRKYKEAFYAYSDSSQRLINWDNWHGYGVWHGQWCWNMPDLLMKNGLNIDMTKRPVMNEQAYCKTNLENGDHTQKDKPHALLKIIEKLHYILYRLKWFVLNRIVYIRLRIWMLEMKSKK